MSKQHTAGEISRSTYQHTHTHKNKIKKARIVVVCVPI